MTADETERGAELVTRRGLSPRMVGRQAALARVRDRIEMMLTSPDDRPSVTLLVGEAGIGKTRLVREALAELPSGVSVTVLSADPSTPNRPFGMLESLAQGGGVEGRRVAGGGGIVDPASAIQALRARAGGRPTIVVFEDLHWIDAESARALDHLVAEHWPHLLVIGTYRPGDLSSRTPGGELLARLERRTDAAHIPLEHFTRAEVAAFLSIVRNRVPSSALIDSMHTRSGGNPFFLEELLQASAGVDAEVLERGELPWTLQDIVERQLDGLDRIERRAAEVAAICHSGSRFDVLARVSGLDEQELIDVLRRLITRDLLVEVGEDRFVFRHALVRDAVENALLARERRLLHDRAYVALTELGAPPEELAFHAHGAGRAADACRLASGAAATALDRGSPFEALRLADLALDSAAAISAAGRDAPSGGPVPAPAGLHAVATTAAWMVGQLDEALDHARQWEEAAVGEGDMAEVHRAQGFQMRIQFDRGDHEAAESLAARLRAEAEAMPAGVEQASLYAALCQHEMLYDRPDEAIALGDLAIDIASSKGAEAVLVRALVDRGSALVMRDGKMAVGELADAADRASAGGDWLNAFRGYGNLLLALPAYGYGAHPYIDRLQQAAERSGYAPAIDVVNLIRLEQAMAAADLVCARRILDEARPRWLVANRRQRGELLFADAQLSLEEGRWADAQTLLDDPAVLSGLLDSPQAISLRLQRAAHAGEAAVASALWDQLIELRIMDSRYRSSILVEVTDNALRAGVPADAVRRFAVDRVFEVREGSPYEFAVVQGLIAAWQGDATAAVEELWTALADPHPVLVRYQIAYLRTLLAENLLRLGRRREAADVATAARAELECWPGWRRDRVDAVRRLLDEQPPDPELTPFERRLVDLVAEGRPNGEIAQELERDAKSVVLHVADVLTKLGLRNRAELAAWAVRRGTKGTDVLPH